MEITKAKLSELKPLKDNVRNHSEAQIKEMMRSLDQFGQTRAMVVDEHGSILVGNGLYMAMKERGDTVADVYRITGLTDTQKKKLILTDNKVYSLGTDNYEMIDQFIQEITLEAGDFDIAGFDEDVLRSMGKEIEDESNYDYSYTPVPEIPALQEAPQELHPQQPVENTAPQQPEAAQSAPVTPQGEMVQKSVVCPCCGHRFDIN